MDMEEELAGIVGRRVDVVNLRAVEESKNRFRKREILSTAETIIAAG
jgi:predicted nucleotidyltransferase